MRLCWNDSFGGPLGELKKEEVQRVYDMGFRVAGVNGGDQNPSDADIAHVNELFDEVGLTPGPYGIGVSPIRPNPDEEREHIEKLKNALEIAGKLNCTALRYSVGSLHETNIWHYHPDNFTDETLGRLVENVKNELVPYAEEAGVVLCPETTQWTIVNSIERMKAYVDGIGSPWAKIIFDPVNHMTPNRLVDSGKYIKCAINTLGDRIGEFHVKDADLEMDRLLVCHINEAPMGTGKLDHATLIRESDKLEAWKTFSLEHIRDLNDVKKAYDHIQGVAHSIGHTWTDPACTHERFMAGECGS
jgi:sugar phosphate isomerase/epimerase